MNISPFIKTIGLCRSYRRGPQEIRAVDNINLDIPRGQFLGIVGASGSGKSTILNLLGGLDTPTSGTIEIDGATLGSLDRRQLSSFRARRIGMVFQSFNLIAHRTALQNVELALYFGDTAPSERREQATKVLTRLGLADRLDHRPADLSGGEQQRVAIARALVKQPEILIADEPTGNLDETNTQHIAAMLTELHREGLTVILATHDMALARNFSQRVMRMHYGQVVDDTSSVDGGSAA